VSVLALVVQFVLLPSAIALFKRYKRSRSNSYQTISSASSDSSQTLAEDELETKKALQKAADDYFSKEGWLGKNGGWMILTWSVLRLAGLVALAVLTGLAAVKAHGTKETLVEFCLLGVFVS
jgi:hypothetical protein